MKILLGIILTLISFATVGADYQREPPSLYKQVADENKIPVKLLYAVILNESRSLISIKESFVILPWPWTVNYNKKGYYFRTRDEAFLFVQPIVERGETLGIGLGQLEWKWHKSSFNQLWDSFDPYLNLTVAAKIIRKQYERKECSTWKKAIGCYHRPAQTAADKKIAKEYTLRVLKIWKEII